MSSSQPAKGLTPSERVLRARMAAHISWAKTDDRSARTAPARQAALARFQEQVDPERRLSSAEDLDLVNSKESREPREPFTPKGAKLSSSTPALRAKVTP